MMNDEKFDALQNDLTSTMERLLKPIKTQLDYHLPPPPRGTTKENPARSCKTLYDARLSRFYINLVTIGLVHEVLLSKCTAIWMQLLLGNWQEVGWGTVAYVDMRNTSHQCPSGLSLSTRTLAPRRVCNVTSSGCVNNSFTVHGVEYSHVCGRIIEYQFRVPVAFYYSFNSTYNDIDDRAIRFWSESNSRAKSSHTRLDFCRSIWWNIKIVRYPTYKCPCINTGLSSPPSVLSCFGSDY